MTLAAELQEQVYRLSEQVASLLAECERLREANARLTARVQEDAGIISNGFHESVMKGRLFDAEERIEELESSLARLHAEKEQQ